MGFARELRARFGLWRPKNAKFISVGRYTYGLDYARVYGCTREARLEIGAFCSIAEEVNFLCRANHLMNAVSTFPFKSAFEKTDADELQPASHMQVGNDVWIGRRAMLMPGVNVGDGAVIGAGSIVTKDVPPYAVVAGNPARILRYRASPEQIDKLLHIRWWEWDDHKIKAEQAGFYGNVDDFIDRHFKG